MAAFAGSALAALAIGYLLATSYLVLRDDLLGAAAARQARMQQAYEDRISMLRAQVDRITSRQLLDQQLVESKVAELLERQTQLTQRQGRIDPILDRMNVGAGQLPPAAPIPEEKPELRARLGFAPERAGLAASWPVRSEGAATESSADRADRMFVAINQSLRAIEADQIEGIDTLAENAFATADQIAEALETAGLPVQVGDDRAAGGPLLPVEAGLRFEERVRELDDALDKLEAVKAVAKVAPIHNPAPGRAVSSSFGVRKDPFLRTPAMHAGIDFRATSGTPVLSAGAGTVKSAGWAGGYGRMVEIDHGNGLTTRYAHMRKIKVKKGQTVKTGDVVGEVGSSGRSTGPHLHYEVRREGTPVDPLRLLKAGKSVSKLL